MRIVISDTDTGEVYIEFQKNLTADETVSFREVYSRLMAALEGSITSILNEVEVPDKTAYREHMYDLLDDGFGNLLKKVFPEIDVGKFDLTAAAVVYAQDQIIQKAEKEGKTYEEMLDEYEAIADRYIAEKRLN